MVDVVVVSSGDEATNTSPNNTDKPMVAADMENYLNNIDENGIVEDDNEDEIDYTD